jgi:hypothetical protein
MNPFIIILQLSGPPANFGGRDEVDRALTVGRYLDGPVFHPLSEDWTKVQFPDG